MPKIKICGNGLDGVWLLAVANFPDDPELREHFYTLKFANEELTRHRAQASIEISTKLLEGLLNAPSHDQMRSLVTTSTKAGFVAGSFLASIFHMHSFPKEFQEPSNRKAVMISQAFAKKSRFGDGSRMPMSENTIRKHLKDFRSVAHLWGAMWLHQVFPMREQREIFGSPEAVGQFLGIAGLLQDFGCWFIPKRAKPQVPLLDARTIWRVPAEATRLVPPWEPSAWMLRVLRDYKARSNTY